MKAIPKTAWIYLGKNASRPIDEGRYCATVIEHPGEETEAVLFVSGWYTAPHPAINEADAWMRANGIEPAG